MAGNDKNRVKLNICGVELAILTEKTQEYTELLASELEAELKPMISAGVPLVKSALLLNISAKDAEKEQTKLTEELMNKLQDNTKVSAGDNSELLAKIAELEEKINLLTADKAALQAENSRISAAKAETERQNKAIKADLTDKAKQLAEISETNQADKAMIASLKSEVTEAKNSSRMVVSQLENMDADEKFLALQEENQVLMELNSELEAKVSELNDKLMVNPADNHSSSNNLNTINIPEKTGNPMRRVIDDTNLTAFYEKN